MHAAYFTSSLCYILLVHWWPVSLDKPHATKILVEFRLQVPQPGSRPAIIISGLRLLSRFGFVPQWMHIRKSAIHADFSYRPSRLHAGLFTWTPRLLRTVCFTGARGHVSRLLLHSLGSARVPVQAHIKASANGSREWRPLVLAS